MPIFSCENNFVVETYLHNFACSYFRGYLYSFVVIVVAFFCLMQIISIFEMVVFFIFKDFPGGTYY